jgi:hypothetical protein
MFKYIILLGLLGSLANAQRCTTWVHGDPYVVSYTNGLDACLFNPNQICLRTDTMTIYCEDTVVSPGVSVLTNVRIEFNIDGGEFFTSVTNVNDTFTQSGDIKVVGSNGQVIYVSYDGGNIKHIIDHSADIIIIISKERGGLTLSVDAECSLYPSTSGIMNTGCRANTSRLAQRDKRRVSESCERKCKNIVSSIKDKSIIHPDFLLKSCLNDCKQDESFVDLSNNVVNVAALLPKLRETLKQ